MASTRHGIGGVIRQAMRETGLSFGATPGMSTQQLINKWGVIYADDAEGSRLTRDAIYKAGTEAMRDNMIAAAAMKERLDDLERELQDLDAAQTVVAERDSSGKWTCPDGYPDPNRGDVAHSTHAKTRGKPICGPTTPERARVLIAHAGINAAASTALRLAADARSVRALAVRTAANDESRRSTAYVQRIMFTSGP
jgi:hypothetical protein